MSHARLLLPVLLCLAPPLAAQPASRPTPGELLRQRREAGEARRAEALAALRERGVPVTLEEFAAAIEPVPDDANAAIELQAAAAILAETQNDLWTDYVRRPELPRLPGEQAAPGEDDDEPVDWDTLGKLVALQADALAALEGVDAKLRPNVDRVRADFGVDWAGAEDGWSVNVLLPDLSTQRQLARLLQLEALVAIHSGEHEAAARSLRRILGVADAVEAGHPNLVGHLVAIGIDALAADTVQRWARQFAADDVMPEQATRELIRSLLDQSQRHAGFRRAVEAEIVFQQNTIDYVLAGGDAGMLVGLNGGTFAIRSRVRLPDDAAFMAEAMAPLLDLAEEDTLAAGFAAVTQWADAMQLIEANPDAYPAASFLMPAMGRAIQVHYRDRADRHLAAVALAVALYRGDHDNALPPALDALVPDYLPRVLIDPLGDGGPLRYDADRGLAWSVGIDGRDDGGRSEDDLRRQNPDLPQPELEELGIDLVTDLTPAE